MKKRNTVFLTTIFPAAKPFLSEFFFSLKNQTCKDFDIIVVNDGVFDFKNIKNQFQTLNIIEFKVNLSPAKNREFGIKKVIDFGYKYLIFGDSDDYFDKNRIQIVREQLENKDIIINDLTVFNKKDVKHNYLKSFIPNKELNISDLYNKNIAGLSNLALNTKLLSQSNISFNDELIAIDWYFLTTILLQNPKAKIYFTNETATYYRQHEQNTIGFNNTINAGKIKLGIQVKLIHYKNLINFCKENQMYKFVSVFETKYFEIQKIKAKIKDKIFFDKYVSVIKNNFNNIFKGWWSEIITIEQFEYYENKANKK